MFKELFHFSERRLKYNLFSLTYLQHLKIKMIYNIFLFHNYFIMHANIVVAIDSTIIF